MGFVDEIATLIASNTTEVGSGTDWPVWLGHLPDSTTVGDRAVAILSGVGLPEMGRPDVESPGLQILVRGQPFNESATSYPDAETIAYTVKNALHAIASGPSSSYGHHYVGIWNEGGPGFIGFDESKRPMFSTNMRVLRSATALQDAFDSGFDAGFA